MRKVIVKSSEVHSMDDWANIIKNYNKAGLDPVFIPADHEIIEPSKKRKKVRPVRKKRSRFHSTLEGRDLGMDLQNLASRLGVG